MKRLLLAAALCLMTVPAMATETAPECGDEAAIDVFNKLATEEFNKSIGFGAMALQKEGINIKWNFAFANAREYQGYDSSINKRFCQADITARAETNKPMTEEQKMALSLMIGPYFGDEGISFVSTYTLQSMADGQFYFQFVPQ